PSFMPRGRSGRPPRRTGRRGRETAGAQKTGHKPRGHRWCGPVLGSGFRIRSPPHRRDLDPDASIEDRQRMKPTGNGREDRNGTLRRFPVTEAVRIDGAQSTEAVIDNGAFGTRRIRFETGRLARQAAGSAVAYLDDDTMVLSATTASKKPKENLDFFPLTVDVEERMYAAGRIPGSFFRREGRPSEDAILTCRLIDRPLRPSFTKGLRNEIQIVETILALHPDHLYDVVAINAASMSTQLAGLPFSGPIGGVRVALIDGQWIGF